MTRPSIRIGTSGFDYKDWYGPFFPPTLKPQHRLEYYAQRFNTLELNITFYQLLSEGAVGALLNKVETGFHFILKAHRDLTHGTRTNAKETMAQFTGTVDWFRQAQKLGGVLVQLPATFERTPSNEGYLRWLVDALAQTHDIVEFRHARWLSDQTMDLLRELRAGYRIVDMPQVRNLPSRRVEVTSPIAYVRFHGQNTAMWQGKASRNERYDYEYTEEELQGWVEPIQNVAKGAEQTYVLFNNHYRGKVAKNAQMLEALLKK